MVGAASAQSSVTLYGYGDLGVGKSAQTIAAKTAGLNTKGLPTVEENQFNPAGADVGGIRIGMRGSEDLGGGLKANFQLESNAYDENGNGSGFNRATWFGISGSFGAVQLGRQARNSVVAGSLSSPAGWRGTDPESAVGIRYSINNNIGTSSRISSMVNYITPTFSGFNARIGYVMAGDTVVDATSGAVTDIALLYSNGPLALSYGYIKAENQEANQGFHGTYDFGVVKVFAGYHDRGAIVTNTAAVPATVGIVAGVPGVIAAVAASSSTVAAMKGYSIGLTAPFGATTLYAQYAKNNDAVGNSAAANPSAYELGVDYNLSKRTALSAFISGIDGLDSGYFVGVRHAF